MIILMVIFADAEHFFLVKRPRNAKASMEKCIDVKNNDKIFK